MGHSTTRKKTNRKWLFFFFFQCSAECGAGNQTRRVFCGTADADGGVTKVADEECAAEERFHDTEECYIPDEDCKALWFSAPWTPVNELIQFNYEKNENE